MALEDRFYGRLNLHFLNLLLASLGKLCGFELATSWLHSNERLLKELIMCYFLETLPKSLNLSSKMLFSKKDVFALNFQICKKVNACTLFKFFNFI